MDKDCAEEIFFKVKDAPVTFQRHEVGNDMTRFVAKYQKTFLKCS